jgi:hypothetical protein
MVGVVRLLLEHGVDTHRALHRAILTNRVDVATGIRCTTDGIGGCNGYYVSIWSS